MLRAALDGAVVKATAEAEAEAQTGTTIAATPEMASVSTRLDQLREELGHAFAAREPDKADSPPDPETEPALAGIINQFQALQEQLQRMDVIRRLDIGSQLANVSRPPVKSEGRFGRFLASAGLVNAMGVVSRALSTTSLVLLAPTLLTISGGALAEALKQTDIAIHDLIITESEAQAERDWRANTPSLPQPRELKQDDHALIHQLSLHYQHYSRARTAREYHVSADSTAIRRRVLDDFAAAQPARFEVGGGPGDHPRNGMPGTEPFGEEAKRAQAILELHARNSSEHDWNAFKEKATAFVRSFGEPLSAGDLGKRLFTELVNTGGSLVIGGDPDSSALHSIIAEVGQPGDLVEEADKLMKIGVLRFATDIRDYGAPDPAGHPLGDSVPLWNGEAEHWAEEVRRQVAVTVAAARPPSEAPPTLQVKLPPDSELKPATAAVRDFMSRAKTPTGAAEASNLITRYADIAPGVLSEEAQTPRGLLLAESSEVVQAIAQGATDAAANFARARSYVALRGFAKIGGVLIGLGPNNNVGPEVVGLDWSDTPKGLMLRIARAGAPPVMYGPFRAEILRQALAYAADGRPVTATMPLAAPLGRRVLIHPALVDSALGCESRLLDQFVDGATGGADYRTEAEQRVLDQTSLYELAWADQFQRLDNPDLDKAHPKLAKFLASLRGAVPKLLAVKELQGAAERAVGAPEAWSDPTLSPVTSKKAYFDAHLVGEIGACLRENHDLASVRACMAARNAPEDEDYVQSLDWVGYPPTPRPESGVRESPYRLTDDLDFLDLGRRSGEALWPFDFMLQITFDSPPEFSRPNDPEFDPNPFEFPAIKQRIHQDVAAAIGSGRFGVPDAARVVADLREFAVLQRFFRLAFDGKLGGGFPLDRLMALGHVSSHEQPAPIRTLTWNVNPSYYDKLKSLGLQPQLAALGYKRDLQQVLTTGDRCPAIAP